MTADRATLLDLASRVEALTEASILIEGEICDALGVSAHPLPLLTASLDAAHALMAEVLPGWELDLTISTRSTARIDPPDFDGEECLALATLPACALVAAVLRAVASQRDLLAVGIEP
jgi:hypothetical protein